MTLIFSYAIMLFQIALNTPTENYPYTFILDAFLVRFSIIWNCRLTATRLYDSVQLFCYIIFI